jgi:hypothetical protein
MREKEANKRIELEVNKSLAKVTSNNSTIR